MEQKKLRESFPQHLCEEYMGRKSTRYHTSNEDFIKRVIEQCSESKNKIVHAFNFLKEKELDNFKTIVVEVFKQLAFDRQANRPYGVYVFIGNDDVIKAWKWFHELSKKEPEKYSFAKELTKENVSKLFGAENGNFSYLSKKSLDDYIYFHRLGLIDKVENVDKKLHIEHFDNNKSSLNLLTSMYSFEPKVEIVNRFVEIFPLIKSQDPTLSGVSCSKMLDLISKQPTQKAEYDNLNNLINGEEDLFEVEEQVFVISLNLEAITKKRTKAGNLDCTSGYDFINQVHNLFVKAQELNLKNFDSFVNKEMEVEKITHHIFRKQLPDMSKAYILKDFTFKYTTEEDKEEKMLFFKDIFNILLTSSIGSQEKMMKTLDAIQLKTELELSLPLEKKDEVFVKPKTRKI